jgi:iron complex transport system substrate-binding protein
MNRTLLSLLVLGLLMACSAAPSAAVPTAAPAPTEAAATTLTSAPVAEAATNAPVAQDADAACESGLRLIRHQLGAACIPQRPERVATNVETLVTNLLLLGIQPLTGPEDQAGWNAPYRSLFPANVSIETITDSGVTEETDLETLLLAEPELIMTYEYAGEPFYDAFSQIAPTVVIERGENADWRERFDREAAILRRETEAAEVISRYEAAIAALPAMDGLTIAFVRQPQNGTFRMDADGSFPGSVMQDAGIEILRAVEGLGEFDGSSVSNISEERLDILSEADIIVTPDWREAGFGEEPDLAGFERFALWQTLPAVQSGRVLVVPGPVYNGGNYAAAQLLLEAIAEAASATSTDMASNVSR